MPPVVRNRDGLTPLKARPRQPWLRTEFAAFAWILGLVAIVLILLFWR